jgi:hypothetical protein
MGSLTFHHEIERFSIDQLHKSKDSLINDHTSTARKTITMKKTTRNKRKGTLSSLSAASMGKALVLLATSCTAFTTGRHAPTHTRGLDLSKHARSDMTVLYYRELDEYHQMVGRSQPVTPPATSTIDVRVATPTAAPTRPNQKAKASSQPDEQIVMDDYLEFVERRYSRMHRRSQAKTMQFIFPAKMMLFYQVRTPPTSDNEALQALGLTGLVSERLRQRLNAPREFRNEHESAVNFFHYFTHQERPTQQVVASQGGRLAPQVSLSFAAQFRLLAQSLSRFFSAYATSMKLMGNFAVRAIPAILEKGGVRHSLKMMSVASLAILLMFRPLMRGFIKQA